MSTTVTRAGLTIALTLLLQACATPVYVSPTSGKTAELSITSSVDSQMLVLAAYDNGEACEGERIIATSRETGSSEIETKIRIKADEAFSLRLFLQRGDGYACNVVVTFDPAADRTYEARLASTAKTCGIGVEDTTGLFPQGEPSLRKREWKPPLLGSSFCQPGHSLPLDPLDGAGDERPDAPVTMDDLKGLLPPR